MNESSPDLPFHRSSSHTVNINGRASALTLDWQGIVVTSQILFLCVDKR